MPNIMLARLPASHGHNTSTSCMHVCSMALYVETRSNAGMRWSLDCLTGLLLHDPPPPKFCCLLIPHPCLPVLAPPCCPCLAPFPLLYMCVRAGVGQMNVLMGSRDRGRMKGRWGRPAAGAHGQDAWLHAHVLGQEGASSPLSALSQSLTSYMRAGACLYEIALPPTIRTREVLTEDAP